MKTKLLSLAVAAPLLTHFFMGVPAEAKKRLRLRRTTGNASYYGPGFHLRSRTASGELMNMYKLTAAHRTLPFGTRLRVTNLRNGKSVVVRINDRGPFHKRRVVDLSLGAFKKIASRRAGIIPVKIALVPRAPRKKPGKIITSLPGQEQAWKMRLPALDP